MYNMGVEVVHITVDKKEIDETDIPAGVVQDPSKISSLFKIGTPMFVEFYATWCGHCVKLAPEWTKLIGLVKKEYENKELAIVSVESKVINKDIDRVLKQAHVGKVEGFPTIGLIHNNKWFVYNGKRVAKDMLDFINENLSGMKGGKRRKTKKRSVMRKGKGKGKSIGRKSIRRKQSKNRPRKNITNFI